MQLLGTIILAAGASTRLGQAKQQLVFQGQTLLQHTLQAALALQAGPAVVVVGANAPAILPDISTFNALVVHNPLWQEGMASSIKAGVTHLLSVSPDLEGILVLLCDQPFVSTALLQEMATAFQCSGQNIIACSYQGTVGAPVLFSQHFFPALRQLNGQEGAKKLLSQYPADVAVIPFPLGGIDIDTPEDYQRLLQL
ncbi:nucleotidyltransferase family protein [Rufibacter ruber]|uniref:nucleotidyltransferase family protein n=1 Tax=Rufibacter ruber TaxID=1783499 RepID=UPI0008375D5C|nr:nucleotidyltransferase family protein [Rufibacter ruber]